MPPSDGAEGQRRRLRDDPAALGRRDVDEAGAGCRGDASRVPASSTNAGWAVDISDSLTSAGVQSGCTCRSSAAAPATAGDDIEVPSNTAHRSARSIASRAPTRGC